MLSRVIQRRVAFPMAKDMVGRFGIERLVEAISAAKFNGLDLSYRNQSFESVIIELPASPI